MMLLSTLLVSLTIFEALAQLDIGKLIPNRETETHTSTGPCGGTVVYEQAAGKIIPHICLFFSTDTIFGSKKFYVGALLSKNKLLVRGPPARDVEFPMCFAYYSRTDPKLKYTFKDIAIFIRMLSLREKCQKIVF